MKTKIEKPNLRKTQAEERRLQIINAALTVFASKGFKGTSIKDIAAAADISMGLMYHYFASKEDLLKATVDHHSFLPQMRQILTDTKDRPMTEVLNTLALGFLQLLDNKSRLIKIFLQEIGSNSLVRKTWAHLVHEGISLLKDYLDSQVTKGELRQHKTEVAARNMLGMLFMYHFTLDIFPTSQIEREEYIQESLNNLLKGIIIR